MSLETPDEARMIENAVASDGVKYIWTSGRKCDFDDCDRADLKVGVVGLRKKNDMPMVIPQMRTS